MKKWLDINANTPEKARVLILGIPFDGGTSQEAGAAEAPAKIREFGEVYMPCATDDWYVLDTQPVVHDFGDVDMSGTWEEGFARVEAEALQMMRYGKFNLFIGGDHSVTIPLHRAFAKAREGKKIGIIHFDAHFDLCDCYDGHKWSHANTEKRALDDIIGPEDLLFLGIRAAEPEELNIIKRNPEITVISASDLDEMGWKECASIIEKKFKGYDHIYFTLDIDVLDPAFAPGTGTPVSGGLTSRELINLVRFILKKLPVRDMDIVEVAPPLDVNDITSWAAMRIIEEVFSFADKEL
ncbi:MAG: agmatinase [Clostridiales bacterium]|nr:agmatinase [Clostridiales bacterium]